MRHSFATLYLDAGGFLRDLQDAMGHADPRTTRRYDRARYSLDRSPGYVLVGYLAEAGQPREATYQQPTLSERGADQLDEPGGVPAADDQQHDGPDRCRL
jgi:hypothetical protein